MNRFSPLFTSRRTLLAAALGTPLAVVAAGCSAHGGAQGAGSSDAGSAKDARIKVAHMLPPRSALNPFTDDAFKLSRWSCAETLVALDDDAKPQPVLATEWKQVEDKKWEFTIREGVKFHNGENLDAQAVVTMLDAAMHAAPKPRILDGVELSASAKSEFVVEIVTAAVDPLIPGRLSSPQLSVLAPSAYKDKAVSPIGCATGPFVLKKLDGTSSATLDRFDGYWGTKAAAAGIDASFVPDGKARAAALRTGEADIVEAIPISQVALLEKDQVHEVPMPRTNTLYVNMKSPVLQDAGLRAAVREAVQKKEIVESVYEGHADVAVGLLGPALKWAAALREKPQYVAATKPSGQAITLGTYSDRAELPEVAVAVQGMLEKAGFTVKQDVREYANIEADALAGKFDIFILSRATVLDSGDPVSYMASDFSSKGTFNLSQAAVAAIDTAVEKAAATPIGDERKKAIMAAEKAILESDCAIPLLHERVIQGEGTHVKGAVRDSRERKLVTVKTTVSA